MSTSAPGSGRSTPNFIFRNNQPLDSPPRTPPPPIPQEQDSFLGEQSLPAMESVGSSGAGFRVIADESKKTEARLPLPPRKKPELPAYKPTRKLPPLQRQKSRSVPTSPTSSAVEKKSEPCELISPRRQSAPTSFIVGGGKPKLQEELPELVFAKHRTIGAKVRRYFFTKKDK